MARIVTYTGVTGQSYLYQICDVNLPWNAVPANYCFARMQGMLYLVPVYFGETKDMAERMSGHNKLTLAAAYGATIVLAHVNHGGEEARKAEEKDLIRAYNPPANVQHRTAAETLLGIRPLPESPLAAALRRGMK